MTPDRDSLLRQTKPRCCNCGTERDDLIEHEGDLWCPEYGDCDRALHAKAMFEDLSHSFEDGWHGR